MQSQRKPVLVGQRVDEVADQFRARAADLAIFSANRIDGPGARTEAPRDLIRLQAGGVDDRAGFNCFRLGVLCVANPEP